MVSDVKVRPYEAGDDARWNAFVFGCPDATFFHRIEWRGIMEGVFRHRTHYLLAERDGDAAGPGERGMRGHVVVPERFLEPQDIERFGGAGRDEILGALEARHVVPGQQPAARIAARYCRPSSERTGAQTSWRSGSLMPYFAGAVRRACR